MSLPLEFLLSASRVSLAEYERSRLDHASKLERQIKALVIQMVKDLAAADVARVMLERDELRRIGVDPLQEVFDFSEGNSTAGATPSSDTERIPRSAAAD